MGRSRSRDKDKDKDRKKDKDRDKDRDRKRSRSRKEKKSRREETVAPEPAPARQRSPSFQYRRWRFDSPPKEEEYQRDAMLTGNPMGLGGVAAALQGGLSLAGMGNMVSPLQLAADTKASRELYVGNLPAGVTTPQLVQFLNQVAQAVKVNSLPGDPILGATMGGGGLFAFVEFRTAEEAANGLRLNGVELLGSQLKVGRPKGFDENSSAAGGLPAGLLALPAPTQTGGGAPSLGEMMAQAGALGRPGQMALPGIPGQAGANVVSAIDHRLCLVNIPLFVSEDRIKELLVTFGQLKFFAMQKDEEGKSVGVAFFEYNDMMTQQQARAALEGLELGAKKLSVRKPDEVIELGLVSRVQKLGNRVVPSKVIYLKNIVSPEELRDDALYLEICTDIRLEGEKFGPVVSMEVPRPRGARTMNAENLAPQPSVGGMLALEGPGAAAGVVAKAALPSAPLPPVGPGAIVPVGGANATSALAIPGTVPLPGQGLPLPPLGGDDVNVAGLGYAFVEFATIEGSSKAKKGLNGRKFGENEVVAEYYSEQRYSRRDLADPKPNTEEPTLDPEAQLALIQANEAKKAAGTLEEAPVMVE